MVNGCLGFTEELKAKASLDELTNKMEAKIAVLRDGRAENLLTRLLVPGDVILLVGGVAVPADVDWLDGDILSIDTAALTGEPLPRMYPSEEYGMTKAVAPFLHFNISSSSTSRPHDPLRHDRGGG